MATKFDWTEQRLLAARLLAEDEQTQASIAAAVGISARQIRNWMQEEAFRDEIDRLRASYSGISEKIRKRLERAAGHAVITRQQIIGRLVEIATASPADFCDDEGNLDIAKARKSGKEHLLKEITTVKRTSRDGSSRVTRGFKIESPLAALDLLTEILGHKKQPGKNPVDAAKETYLIMRQDERYKDVPDEELAGFPAQRFRVSVAEILEGQS